MAYTSVKAGTTGYDIQFPIGDSSSSTGALLTGLAYNSAGLVAVYNRQGNTGTAVAISLVTKTKGTWASGGFVAHSTSPGWYELGIPDAAIATGAKHVAIQIYGAANMVPVNLLIELTATDNQDANSGGLGRLDASISSIAGSVWGAATRTLTAISDSSGITTLLKLGKNKVITDPLTHTYKVFDDDEVTVLVSGLLYEDADATVPYRGQGISRREKLT